MLEERFDALCGCCWQTFVLHSCTEANFAGAFTSNIIYLLSLYFDFLYLFPTINIWNIQPLQIFSGGFDWHFKLLSQCNSIKALRRNPVPFVCMSNDCSVLRCSAGTCLPAWIKLINSERATLACMISHGGYRRWDMTQCSLFFVPKPHYPLSIIIIIIIVIKYKHKINKSQSSSAWFLFLCDL